LNGERDVVVREGRRAGDFGPVRAGEGFANAVNAQGKVRSGSATRDHAIGAAIGSNLKQQLAEVRTEQLVVGADIGSAGAVRSIRVEGDDSDTGSGSTVDHGGGGSDIRH